MKGKIAIIGAGNIGTSIAKGLVTSKKFEPNQIILTRKRATCLEPMRKKGFIIGTDNPSAVERAAIVILSVEPIQIGKVLAEINKSLKPDFHTLISIATGVTLSQLSAMVEPGINVIRATPNTAIAINKSVTCIAGNERSSKSLRVAKEIFDALGVTSFLEEEKMTAATALGACGIAFFLRAIRAAMHGGIEIGLDSEEALKIAAQAALGAAALLQDHNNHPEIEIDRVTTPRGCTIAGLNKMEHGGFSSALISGIIASAERAGKLYTEK